MGKRPRGMKVSVDDKGRTHPAKMECRVVPEVRVGGEVRKVRGQNVLSQTRPFDVQLQIMLLLMTTVDIY